MIIAWIRNLAEKMLRGTKSESHLGGKINRLVDGLDAGSEAEGVVISNHMPELIQIGSQELIVKFSEILQGDG